MLFHNRQIDPPEPIQACERPEPPLPRDESREIPPFLTVE